MRIPRALVAVGAVAAVAVTSPWAAPQGAAATAASAAPAAAAAAALAPGVTAYFEMNEPTGTTVMHDSGPRAHDAPVDPTGLTSGVEADGAIGYLWEHRDPEAPPPRPSA